MSEYLTWHAGTVTSEDRAKATTGLGITVWLTGLSGSGKSSIAWAAEAELIARGRAAYVLDGDNLRQRLNADLGFSDAYRSENVRRVALVAQLMADAGLVVLVPVIAPFAADRDRIRIEHETSGLAFLEVFVDAPLEVCEQRDPKGLYAKAWAGQITNLTGLDSPYEEPITRGYVSTQQRRRPRRWPADLWTPSLEEHKWSNRCVFPISRPRCVHKRTRNGDKQRELVSTEILYTTRVFGESSAAVEPPVSP